jgi:cytochrome c5
MKEFRCLTCLSTFESDELPRRGSVCFKCHVKTIRLGFTHGKEDFHGPTIAERQRQTVADAAAKGINAEPVTNWM